MKSDYSDPRTAGKEVTRRAGHAPQNQSYQKQKFNQEKEPHL
jgi:hypothetical protein